MSQVVDNITRFVDYAAKLDGDEKGEAQVFCDPHSSPHFGGREHVAELGCLG
jgi:hypothetical protein